jgi:hypothetical protein
MIAVIYGISFAISFVLYIRLFVRGGNPCCNEYGGYFLTAGLIGLIALKFTKSKTKKIVLFVTIGIIMLFLSSILASMIYSCICEM